jgi:hypothetical protein
MAARLSLGPCSVVASCLCSLQVHGQDLIVRVNAARVGALPIPRAWLASWATRHAALQAQLLDGDLGLHLPNEWTWPPAKRRFRISHIQVQAGGVSIRLEPL